MNKHNHITKRCERCEKLFTFPNLRESNAREVIIQYAKCSHCHYVPDVRNPKFNQSGRCVDCSVPFSMIDHKAKGRCHRCLMAFYRKNSTKT